MRDEEEREMFPMQRKNQGNGGEQELHPLLSDIPDYDDQYSLI